MARLVFGRRPGQGIQIGDDVTVTFVRYEQGVMTVSVDAPRAVPVRRSELPPRRSGLGVVVVALVLGWAGVAHGAPLVALWPPMHGLSPSPGSTEVLRQIHADTTRGGAADYLMGCVMLGVAGWLVLWFYLEWWTGSGRFARRRGIVRTEDVGMGRDVTLEARDGGRVVVVKVPAMFPAPEIIAWGGRFFLRCTDHLYREGLVYVVPEASRTPGHAGDCECRSCGGTIG